MEVVYLALSVQLFKHENSTWRHSKCLNHTSLPTGKVSRRVIQIFIYWQTSQCTPQEWVLTTILTSLKLGGTNLLHLNLTALLKFWQKVTDKKWIAHKILYRAVPWENSGDKNKLPSLRKKTGKKTAWRFWGGEFAVVRIYLVGCLLFLLSEWKTTEDLNYMALCFNFLSAFLHLIPRTQVKEHQNAH